MLNLLFCPSHLGIGFIQTPLSGMDGVGGGKMRRPQFFDLAFGFAQAGCLCLQFQRRRVDIPLDPDALPGGIALAGQPQHLLRRLDLGVQFAEPGRLLGLRLQMLQLFSKLLADILDTQQVFPGVLQTQFGLAPALAVFRHARRFLEEVADVLGFRLDDARDHALLDDGVAAPAETGTEENVGDVTAPHMLVVDVVTGFAVALKHPLDRDLAVLGPCPGGLAQAVIENQLDAGAGNRLALPRPVEDDVLHAFAAQLLGGGFAKHPAHRIDDVGLAAAIGAHYADKLARNRDVRGVDEGFESGKLDVRESQLGGRIRI
jgi:hypothetical protein